MPLSNELRDSLRAEVAQLREEGCDAEVLANELSCIEQSLERQAVSLYHGL